MTESFVKFSPSFLESYRKRNPKWGFGNIGYIVYKRTYARELENGKTEEWVDTLQRCIEGAQKIGANYTKEEAERLFDLMFNLKCLYAGRMLWQLGTSTVDRFGANSLLNCWGLAMKDTSDFCFLFENLMLGGGVGFSVKREDVHELPKIKKDVVITHLPTKDADFIVPDSREGWVRLLKHTLDAFFYNGESFTYSTILIRGYGEKIKGFGGTASGPGILVDGIEKICNVIKSREGKKLRSIDVLDICNIIGSIVVAGNVRRSAEIAVGDPDDFLFLRAKRWDTGNIPNWRAMSNNTIGADSYDQISDSVWDGYKGNGEPYGFFNLPLSQKYGRLGEERKDNCIVLNPCGEITLADHECCNLSEIFLNNIESKEELIEAAKLIYKTQKAICKLPFIHKETNDIVHKNMRIGLGISGICQSLEKIEWLDDVYKELRKYDKQFSKENKLPESIKLTTVKPSGTISILAGSTPGVHPGYARYFIRRIRMSSSDPLVSFLREMNYHIEYLKNFDGTEDRNTVIIEFPCEYSENTILSKNMKAVEQLELVKKIQTVWSDNAVSVTVYYKKEELKDIQKWMKDNYENSIKSVSFLLHSDHGFRQAPYEEIDEQRYNLMLSRLKTPTKTFDIGSGNIEDLNCESGVCPIK
jgi:ribonucleotide reductase alpha subunit